MKWHSAPDASHRRGATPDPNQLYPLMFQSLATKISTDHGAESPLDPGKVKEEFGADWGQAMHSLRFEKISD